MKNLLKRAHLSFLLYDQIAELNTEENQICSAACLLRNTAIWMLYKEQNNWISRLSELEVSAIEIRMSGEEEVDEYLFHICVCKAVNHTVASVLLVQDNQVHSLESKQLSLCPFPDSIAQSYLCWSSSAINLSFSSNRYSCNPSDKQICFCTNAGWTNLNGWKKKSHKNF